MKNRHIGAIALLSLFLGACSFWIGREPTSSQSPSETPANTPPPGGQIIVDHTAVDRFDDIPATYLAAVKDMWFSVPGESHSQAYRTGLGLLENADSDYATDATTAVDTNPAPAASTGEFLRSSRAAWGDVDSAENWQYGYGEEDWFTSATAIDRVKAHIAYCDDQGMTISALGLGWCWDMTAENSPGGTVDPVYHVRWAGRSYGGAVNGRWGLDSGDQTLTGNAICMDTYLDATQELIDYCDASGISTKVFFTTGPVDGYEGENGYQRHLKHEHIREFVEEDPGRILFDYADILCWNDAGEENTTSWTDGTGTVHTYQVIHSDNLGSANIGHIGAAGALRLGKAAWWMMARIAGWDGLD